MRVKSRYIFLFFLTALSSFLMSWGYNGHYKINQNASLSFTPEMEQFMSWSVTLAEHASDADYRKDIDPYEEMRHYIDIDNYPEFVASGKIPQTYDSVVALHGLAFVHDQGILPWATKSAYDSLVRCFTRFDWERAVLVASDIGHYVADGHQPLHITRNYDGQYSGNNDIHSHYETGMINAYKDEIIYSGEDISFITDVNEYIFSYLYANCIYVDSIMAADDYAQAVAGNNTSSTYKAALWEKTRGFTIPLFKNGSHALAELIYSAWVEAGKPDKNSGPGIFEFYKQENVLQLNLSPNPVKEIVKINFVLKENSETELKIMDLNGKAVGFCVKENLPAGPHEFSFNLANLPEGIYFISVDAGKWQEGIKVIRINNSSR